MEASSRRTLLLGRPAEAAPRVARLSAGCLARMGVACMSCRDACPTGAIRFALAPGGAQPRVEAALCTGCAECAPVCPSGAIALPAEASLA